MAAIRKVIPLQTEQISESRTRLIAATNQLARDGHVLEPAGIEVANFLRTGTILFDHDPKVPVGVPVSAALNAQGNLEVEIEWAPLGISARADEIRGLVKASVIRAGSVGFEPVEMEPLDRSKPRGGQHITKSELLELSFVSVPADTGAVVTQRNAEDWKCGASRDLPIEDSDSWDGAAAESSIFEWAGGDDFDPSKARKGFLAYNATKPKERGSYKLPIAHVTGGRMKVPKGAIRAAASRVSQADIPDSVKETAKGVIAHYEEKAGMGESKKDDRSIKAKHTRALERAPSVPVLKRGLYEVASLAYMLEQLGYAHACSEWEAECEGDDSPVPAMLGDALVKCGEAFIAMAKEEASELLAAKDLEMSDDEIPEGERAYVSAAATPRARAWRAGIAMARAGKSLSASNEKKLEDAQAHHDRAMKHHKALGEHHDAVGAHMDAITSAQEKAQKAHGDAGEALAAAKSEPDKAAEHVVRAMKAHKALGAQLDDMTSAQADMKDRHQDVGDSHQAMGRCMRSAQRCVRSVVDGSTSGAEDGDSKNVQTSSGTGESTGSEGSRNVDYRRRQADLLALAQR